MGGDVVPAWCISRSRSRARPVGRLPLREAGSEHRLRAGALYRTNPQVSPHFPPGYPWLMSWVIGWRDFGYASGAATLLRWPVIGWIVLALLAVNPARRQRVDPFVRGTARRALPGGVRRAGLLPPPTAPAVAPRHHRRARTVLCAPPWRTRGHVSPCGVVLVAPWTARNVARNPVVMVLASHTFYASWFPARGVFRDDGTTTRSRVKPRRSPTRSPATRSIDGRRSRGFSGTPASALL